MEERLKTRGRRQQNCLFDGIYSFNHKQTFNLQIIFRCLLKLTARGQTRSQEQLIIPMAKDFETWKENRKKKKKSEKWKTGCSLFLFLVFIWWDGLNTLKWKDLDHCNGWCSETVYGGGESHREFLPTRLKSGLLKKRLSLLFLCIYQLLTPRDNWQNGL